MISDDERAALHARLDQILDGRDSYRVEGNSDLASARRRIEAQMKVKSALSFCREISGSEAIADALLTDRGSNLSVAGSMLDLANRFFDHRMCEPTISDVAFELHAIDAGELARVIVPPERPKKTPSNIFRRWHHQLEALCWDVRLAAVGFSTQERHRLIEDAFRHQWRSISAWQSVVREGLGEFRVDVALHFARVEAASVSPLSDNLRQEWVAAVERAGAAYIADNTQAKGPTR